MKKKKNILIFSSEFPPGPGGIGNHAFNLAKGLSKSQFNVKVLTPFRSRYSNNVTTFEKQKGFETIYYRKRSNKFITLFYIYKLLIKLTREFNPLIISSGTVPLIFVGFLSSSKKIAIIHGHETRLGNFLIRYLVSINLKRYNKLIAVSKFSKSRVTDFHPSLSVDIINNGADFSRLKLIKEYKKVDSFRPDLITVGTLSLRKGQHNVINVLPEIKKSYPNVLYHMVGQPNIKNELIALARKNNVEENIKFYNYLDDNELNELMCKCDIFIMLSENLRNGDVEGFGIAIIEGNYIGLPSVGSKGCGIEDAIKDDFSGILVENTNYQDIVSAIDKISNNYLFFSKESKKWAEEFHWEIIIKKYLNVIYE